jgi:nucleoside-diphosphate-sugar epimerase
MRVYVEKLFINYYDKYSLPFHIFRISGIYGLGRNLYKRLVIADGNVDNFQLSKSVITSRIHVDDLSQVILASMFHPTPGHIINIADNLPATPYEVS